ncbi:isoaspartyl peptidase/L-asparaginase [Candidatus Woesearchaeota archaeon]|nr:isoaspartyl peptidase/L-asparaginase [Candidatus Woesearchaeota archaeon]
MKAAIILHGGAGDWNEYNQDKAKKILEKAANIGIKILKKGGSSLDAVEKSINLLEDSGYFDCGLGSVTQNDGKIRMDAGIMDGFSLKCGSVAAIENIKNPISVARKVMEKTNHCLIVSKYATKFAVQNGFKTMKIRPKQAFKSEHSSDTVGAVAVDMKGRIAVGNSTGGVYGKMIPGRVGGSPIAGAGFYANEYAGAATTGVGESFIRTVMSKHAVDISKEKPLKNVVESALRTIKQKTGCNGGIIILNKKGNFAAHYTTKAMPWVYKKE